MIQRCDFIKTALQRSPKSKQPLNISKALVYLNWISTMIMLSVFMGCEPAIEPTRQFITRKGDHYSMPRWSESMHGQTLMFDARFDMSAVYDFEDISIQSSKNKLMGFCDCNSLPHENSARFAWQWFNNRLEIYAYCYASGNREEKFIGVVNINEYNHYELEFSSDQYIFRLNNQTPVIMKRGATCNTGVYSKLWPYFGGQVAAPHDVTINIKSIY